MQRGSELVAKAGEELRLDPVRRFGFSSRLLLADQRHFQLARALRHPRIEYAIESFQTFFALPLPLEALGAVSVLGSGERLSFRADCSSTEPTRESSEKLPMQ